MFKHKLQNGIYSTYKNLSWQEITDVHSFQHDIFNSYTKPLLLGKQLLIFLKISVKLAVLSFDIMIIYI